jgi:hypothetical protein
LRLRLLLRVPLLFAHLHSHLQLQLLLPPSLAQLRFAVVRAHLPSPHSTHHSSFVVVFVHCVLSFVVPVSLSALMLGAIVAAAVVVATLPFSHPFVDR